MPETLTFLDGAGALNPVNFSIPINDLKFTRSDAGEIGTARNIIADLNWRKDVNISTDNLNLTVRIYVTGTAVVPSSTLQSGEGVAFDDMTLNRQKNKFNAALQNIVRPGLLTAKNQI